MNKKLIKKYKAEFNHWLEDGKVLTLNNRKLDTWEEVNHEDFWRNPSSKPIFIINDKYVEFRKAIAEGCTIQYNPLTESHDRWDDIITPHKFTYDVKHYRVKPTTEFKFTINDYVNTDTRWTGKVIYMEKTPKGNVYTIDLTDGDTLKFYEEALNLWKPKSNEWCIFYTENPKYYTIAKFDKMTFISQSCGKFYTTTEDVSFKNCVPFKGDLPC